MRVAVCLSGEMRGCSACLSTLVPQVVDPFKIVGAVVDLLVCTRADKWWRVAADLPFRMLHVETNSRMDESDIINDANPPKMGSRSGQDRRAFLYQSYLQYYRSLQTVGEMLTRAEEQDGEKYDWVVRARPDAKLEKPLSVESLVLGEVHFPCNDRWPHSDISGKECVTLSDKFAVGPSDSMHTYFDRIKFVKEFCLTHALHAEALVCWQMEKSSIKWNVMDSLVVLRDDKIMYEYSVRPDEKE